MPNLTKGKRKKRSSTGIQSVSVVLPAVGKKLNLDKKVQEWSLLSLWEQIIDEPFKKTTRAVRVKPYHLQNILMIQVESATVAAELAFYLEKYQNKINAYFLQTGLEIHRIELRVF